MLSLRYQLTSADYLSASHAFFRRYDPMRNWLLPLIGSVGFIVVLGAVVTWRLHPGAPLPWEALTIGGLWSAAGLLFPEWSLRRRFRRDPCRGRELLAEMDETGLRLHIAGEATVVGWVQLSGAAQTPRVLALFQGRKIHILPWRAMTAEQRHQIVAWLRAAGKLRD